MTPENFLALALLADIPLFYGIFRLFFRGWRECWDDWVNPSVYEEDDLLLDGYGKHLYLVCVCICILVFEYMIYVLVLGGKPIPFMDWIVEWLDILMPHL